MSAQIISLRLIVLTFSLLLWGAGIGVPANMARAADCLGAPTSGPPEGSHWYYRTDRATGRKCWHLGGLSPPPQDTAAQEDESAATGAAPAGAGEPATASAGAHTEPGAVNSSPPLPPPRPQPTTSASSATTREPVRQPAQEETAAPAIPEPPIAQSSASSETNGQGPAAPPAAAVVWPDPPAVATVKVQEPKPVASEAPPYAIQTTVGARAADDPEGIAQTGAQAGEAATTTAASGSTLGEILLIVVLALTAASLLYRLVAKITAARDRRIVLDHSGLDWAHDDRHEHQFGRRQRGFVDERQKFVNNSRLSLAPTADDYGARRLRPIAPQSKGLQEGRTSQIAGELGGRENRWAQLLRDLDQIMQSRKEA